MQINIVTQRKQNPPQLQHFPQPFIDLTSNEVITFCVCEGGMKSGDPSVIIASNDEHGSIFLQTSLDKLLTAASSCLAIAETYMGWVRQEGSFTIIPPSKEMRMELLKSIKKELEEYGDD